MTEPRPSTPDVSLLQLTEYRIYDGLVATGFLICLVIGLPGNCLALRYFLQTGKRNISTILYMIICCIDIVSSMIHLPVTFNWLNSRHPGLFGNRPFCKIWYFFILVLEVMSTFVAMLLSLTRTIVIHLPFYKIKKNAVLISIIVAFLYNSVWNALDVIIMDDYYSYGFGYCAAESEGTYSTISMINCCVWTGIPPLITLISVVDSMKRMNSRNLPDTFRRKNREASKTIMYFSAIFLVCNCLTFVNNALYTVTSFENYPGPIYKHGFMFFYSWLLSELFCTVLNATLNPILYFWRMKQMREWLMRPVRNIFGSVSTTTVIANPTNLSQGETTI